MTTTHDQVVDELLSIFDRLSEESSLGAGGFGSERETYVSDASGLSREELAESLRDAERFLLAAAQNRASEDMIDDFATTLALADSLRRVEAALRVLAI